MPASQHLQIGIILFDLVQWVDHSCKLENVYGTRTDARSVKTKTMSDVLYVNGNKYKEKLQQTYISPD